MKLLIDESVNKAVVDKLRNNGFDVLYVAEFSPSVDDETVLTHANNSRSLLLTADKDLGN